MQKTYLCFSAKVPVVKFYVFLGGSSPLSKDHD